MGICARPSCFILKLKKILKTFFFSKNLLPCIRRAATYTMPVSYQLLNLMSQGSIPGRNGGGKMTL